MSLVGKYYQRFGSRIDMGSTPLKKVIKAKIKAKRELTEMEKVREQLKYEIAEELGLTDKIQEGGWGALTAEESGRIGGMMTKRKKKMKLPKNKDILKEQRFY